MVPTDTKKMFDKIKHLQMTKTFSALEIEGDFKYLGRSRWKIKDWKRIYHENHKNKKSAMTIWISDNVDQMKYTSNVQNNFIHNRKKLENPHDN